jgi:hypothetical protein
MKTRTIEVAGDDVAGLTAAIRRQAAAITARGDVIISVQLRPSSGRTASGKAPHAATIVATHGHATAPGSAGARSGR